MANLANIALDGGDPRTKNSQGVGVLPPSELPSKDALHQLHDPNVSLEEYMYYASVSRKEEERLHGAHKYLKGTPEKLKTGLPEVPFTVLNSGTSSAVNQVDEKGQEIETESTSEDEHWGVPLNEWQLASRARRTATWGAIFYLITTDILGPASVPWALTQMGLGPGIALYFVFGALAFYAGIQIWHLFMRLDSIKYPLTGYGDIAFRIFGPWARNTVNILQSVQLFFNVGILILGKGQSIYQLTVGPQNHTGLCFIVCSLIFAIAGFLLGQVRSLARFGWIANFAVWVNIVLLCLTMGVAAHNPPNYDGAAKQSARPLPIGSPGDRPKIIYYAGVPEGLPFEAQIVGLMQAVYSYGGAMLYCEFMSEMKKPWDFFKAQICAEAFIFFVYIFFGCFVYGFQGQFALPDAWQGLEPYAWQSAGNSMALVGAVIAAALYGNIGIKVIYHNVLEEIFHFPPLESKTGKLIWVGLVPIYWSLGFVVCSAIPNITSFSGLVAAVCIMQFSYTFPPALMLGYDVQKDAMLSSETFDPATGRVERADLGWKRWARGLKKNMPNKLWLAFFVLGSAVTAVLGVYSSILGLISAFTTNASIVAFSCTAPI